MVEMELARAARVVAAAARETAQGLGQTCVNQRTVAALGAARVAAAKRALGVAAAAPAPATCLWLLGQLYRGPAIGHGLSLCGALRARAALSCGREVL